MVVILNSMGNVEEVNLSYPNTMNSAKVSAAERKGTFHATLTS